MKILIRKTLLLISIIFSFLSCENKHFITDEKYREKVDIQFEKQKLLASNRYTELFSIFDNNLNNEELEALKFLYAYMPLNDLADNNGDFFLQNVKATLEAKNTFSWCKSIPEDIFRHFVLPIRVNNENIDSSRIVFFKELKNRVLNLSMKDAALEVNHWCLEKVTYKASDPRTSSPLCTLKSAEGRCGEESTFFVAALRSVGIPARQCYTPRWAASDDNHAWVEIWIDNKWHFAGACEPTPDLNMGWFSAPVKRAMLVNTNVFGDYSGPEEVLNKTDYFTKINILSNYAPVKTIYTKIIDKNKYPIDSAEVNYTLYNYAEFFPLATKYSDENGICSFTSGFGDLLIWASHNNNYVFEKISVSDIDTITLLINNTSEHSSIMNYTLVPPIEKAPSQLNNEKLIIDKAKENEKRCLKDDSIRKLYTSTFIDSSKIYAISKKNDYNFDSLKFVLEKSNGNWKTLLMFLENNSKYKNWKLPLLYSLQEKDLKDISTSILNDHLENAFKFTPEINITEKENFIKYILCPRIYWEKTSCYRKYFQTHIPEDIILNSKSDINHLIKWINQTITINNFANYYNVPSSPKGTFELKVADKLSRDILFVAICRSIGIVSRLEIATRQVQIFKNNQWQNIYFETKNKEMAKKNGYAVFNNKTNIKNFTPLYFSHFTIGKLSNGKFKTLDYENNKCVQSFPSKIELEAGKYLLITGSRLKSGSVLSKLTFFNISENTITNVDIVVREEDEIMKPICKINTINSIYINKAKVKISDLTLNNLAVFAWIDAEKEPSKHYLKECQDYKTSFEKWKGNFMLLFSNNEIKSMFHIEKYKNLPSKTQIGIDSNGIILKQIEKQTKQILNDDLPVVIVINKSGEILFLSKGYSIGIAERLIKILFNKQCCAIK